METTLNVFTDGSCRNNGKPDAIAGVGIFFGDGDPRNVSARIGGLQTNNRAELLAIDIALSILIEDHTLKYDRCIVYTDSMYSINSLTIWMKKWKLNGWKTASGKEVKNQDILEGISQKICTFKNLQFCYIEAHTGRNDAIAYGNRQADTLARLSWS